MFNADEIPCQYVTNENGEKTAVILDIGTYNQILEGIQDLAAVAERREEPTISHADLIAELKKDGLLQN